MVLSDYEGISAFSSVPRHGINGTRHNEMVNTVSLMLWRRLAVGLCCHEACWLINKGGYK